MKTKQEKIDEIYEVMANKELSFGCKILDKSRDKWSNIFYVTKVVAWWCDLIVSDVADDHCWYEHIWTPKARKFSDFIIIWHPVMIWNCDKLIEKWPEYYNDWITILDLWVKKEEPIEGQSDKSIDYIYNLI